MSSGVHSGWLTWLLIPVLAFVALTSGMLPTRKWPTVNASGCHTSFVFLTMNDKVQQLRSGQADLATSGVVWQQVCQAGTLEVHARGTPAVHLFPLMTVALDSQPLLTVRVANEKMYRVSVPASGLLSVTFHDDMYLPYATPPEDRNLFLTQWHYVPKP